MLTIGIILLAIAIIGLLMYIYKSKECYSILLIYIFIVCFMGTVAITTYTQEKETAINALKGNNPYKMEIIYQLKDSVYIPVDTIYVKK